MIVVHLYKSSKPRNLALQISRCFEEKVNRRLKLKRYHHTPFICRYYYFALLRERSQTSRFRSTWRIFLSGSLEPNVHQHCGLNFIIIQYGGRHSCLLTRIRHEDRYYVRRSPLEIRSWTLKLHKEVPRVMREASLCLRCFETLKLLRYLQQIQVSYVNLIVIYKQQLF